MRNELDRAALAVHSTMLEWGRPVASKMSLRHGFVCGAAPVLTGGADGAVSMQVVPPGWNASNDSYARGPRGARRVHFGAQPDVEWP